MAGAFRARRSVIRGPRGFRFCEEKVPYAGLFTILVAHTCYARRWRDGPSRFSRPWQGLV